MSSLIRALQGITTVGLFNLLILFRGADVCFLGALCQSTVNKVGSSTIQPMHVKKIWRSLFTTGSGGQSAHRTTFGVNQTIQLSVVTQNGYHANFIHNICVPCTQKAGISRPEENKESDNRPTVVIPYKPGISEDTKHVCRKLISTHSLHAQ